MRSFINVTDTGAAEVPEAGATTPMFSDGMASSLGAQFRHQAPGRTPEGHPSDPHSPSRGDFLECS